jgi:hypothetical protein
MSKIVCLANSYKHSGRCIAGIDIDTGEWIRPIGNCYEGAVGDERLINGQEPQILDLLDIPIGSSADASGCQPENRKLNDGLWTKLRPVSVKDVEQYIQNTQYLLYNCDKKVDPHIFKNMPTEKRKSFQLIRVTGETFELNHWNKPLCSFTYSGTSYKLKVTDPIIISKIQNGENISQNCLLTISMATPYQPKSYDKPYCWKMVAGVIEM